METQRLLLYMAFGFISLILYQTWMQDYHAPVPVQSTAPAGNAGTVEAPGVSNSADMPDASSITAAAPAANTPIIDKTISTPTVSVKTDVMDIEISTLGATITKVLLNDYPVSIEEKDTPFTLMSNTPARFLVGQSGLLSSDPNSPVPNHDTPMSVEADSYVMGDNNTLSVPFIWQSDDGKTVTKTITFTKGSYEILVDYVIDNASDQPWAVSQYRQLKRKPGTSDEKQQFLNTYIGAVVSNPEDRYNKVSFGDMEDERLDMNVTNGWVAMIQHYFAAAWVPTPDEVNTAYSRYLPSENRYIIGMISAAQTVPAGTQATFSTKAYIGPKIQENLKATAEYLELTVDYGWLTIIAQPLFWLLKFIHGYVGNWGWAIILSTCVIKAIFYKLSESSYRSMAKMKKLQPKLLELKERYGDDRAKMGQATMELYKKEKTNPLGGCLPMIIQMPVFIALYWTLLESVELRQAPWMFHIKDLSLRDPYFILPVLMAVSMYIQQKLNPAPVDPIQAKVFQFLPLIFGVFFAMFPAGLVLYWVVNNTLTILQQYYITKKVLGDDFGKSMA
jgi:YidC/Oxa1 family membrane protein insertase